LSYRAVESVAVISDKFTGQSMGLGFGRDGLGAVASIDDWLLREEGANPQSCGPRDALAGQTY